jgi:hypothetical protein
MSEQQSIASFVDKWRARWPEWAVAEVFVPADQRDTAVAWASLVQELTDAAWGGSDSRPGEAKLGWWVEELQGWARGVRRHPLGLALQKRPVPWAQLAAALPSLRASRDRPVDEDDARRQVELLAAAIATVEAGLFAGNESAAAEAVTSSLLHLRLAHHPAEAVPLQVLAQAGEGAIAEWTRRLAARFRARGATRPRQVWAGLAQARLQRGKAVEPLTAARALWVSWRSARLNARA